jgi:hypothetical protein
MDDPMPVRHFERVRELLRDQERLCVASIEVSEQWRTQGGKKVKAQRVFQEDQAPFGGPNVVAELSRGPNV